MESWIGEGVQNSYPRDGVWGWVQGSGRAFKPATRARGDG
jgi:hypothetical protein